MNSTALTQPGFHNFDRTHLLVMALTVAVPLLLAWIARRTRSEVFVRMAYWILAVILGANFVARYIHLHIYGQLTIVRLLPMQLCDWALVVTIGALLTRSQRWFELAYFWGLGGTFQAIITPNLTCGFPTFTFLSFFLTHSGIVAAVLFLLFATSLRPHPISLLRVLLWSEIYLACALLANWLSGANYGFLSRKPTGTSILGRLSDISWTYVLEINALTVVLFAVLYFPFLCCDFASSWRKSKN
ncbi:TIGR02206 family membrane protein [soil metagenome]